MTCRHTRSEVTETREEGHDNAPSPEFRYEKFRRRKCLDCGYNFQTFELTPDQIDKANDDACRRLHAMQRSLREILGIAVSGNAR